LTQPKWEKKTTRGVGYCTFNRKLLASVDCVSAEAAGEQGAEIATPVVMREGPLTPAEKGELYELFGADFDRAVGSDLVDTTPVRVVSEQRRWHRLFHGAEGEDLPR